MQASQESGNDSKRSDTLLLMLKSLPGWLSLFLFWSFRYPFCIIAVGLLVIEVRTGWTIIRHPCSNFPTVVALFDRVFWPERLLYVASADLHRGHMHVETDLAVGSNVRSYLRSYLPVES